MYAGVDVGGSKTIAAVLDDNGTITESAKFPTPANYDEFLATLSATYKGFSCDDFKAAGVGIPATNFDRERGVGIAFGNLPWEEVPIQTDIERLLNCPVAVENDAKLGGLSEAMLLKDKYRKVLYVTVSTGIGTALIVDRRIDTAVGDGGGRTILLEFKGKLVPWESFASGKAIVERYGVKGEDIKDEAIWSRIAHDLALGFMDLIAILAPDVIVVGGSVGVHFKHYGKYLVKELKSLETPLQPIPPLIEAQRPELAVVYGCYDLAKAMYGSTDS